MSALGQKQTRLHQSNQIVIEEWRKYHGTIAPLSDVGYCPPAP
jgi:hypothetical protein